MKSLKDFNIPFSGLKIGKHIFDYSIDNQFFKHYNYEEFNDANIKIDVILDKKSTFFELHFSHKGTVNVPCDISNENFDLPIKGNLLLIVKFGEEFNDENDEILILPHGEFQVNVAQYIYEMIALSVPLKRIHPAALNTEEEEFDDTEEQETNDTIQDPRWDKLKNFLTN